MIATWFAVCMLGVALLLLCSSGLVLYRLDTVRAKQIDSLQRQVAALEKRVEVLEREEGITDTWYARGVEIRRGREGGSK